MLARRSERQAAAVCGGDEQPWRQRGREAAGAPPPSSRCRRTQGTAMVAREDPELWQRGSSINGARWGSRGAREAA